MSSPQRWFRFFPSDWLSMTGGLSPTERGVLFSLVCLMFDRGEPLARNDARLARQCGMPTSGFRKALAVLLGDGKLIEKDGSIWSEWVEMEHKISTEKTMAASRSANARWGKKTNENKDTTDADALPKHSERNANQNQNINTPIGPKGRNDGIDLSGMSREIGEYTAMGIKREAAVAVLCHRCGASPGAPCTGPDGAARARPHIERYQLVAHLQKAPKESTAIDWPARLKAFREEQIWPHAWGPKPGEPGCKALVPIDQDDPLRSVIESAGHSFIVARSGNSWQPYEVVEKAKAAMAGAA